MPLNEPEYDEDPVLRLRDLDLDEAFLGLHKTIVLPFPEQPTSDAYWKAWHLSESDSRSECVEAVQYWLSHRRLPLLGEDAVAFFLSHRFDQVTEFVELLFSKDGGTPLTSELSLWHLLHWLLVDWWDSHGIRQAFFEDLAKFENKEA